MNTPIPAPEFTRYRRRSFATAELPDEKVEAIRCSRMDDRPLPSTSWLDLK